MYMYRLTWVDQLDELLEDRLLNDLPLVVSLSHLLEVNTGLDIFPETLDKLDVDIGLQERGADLLEEGVEDIFVDDCGLAQVVKSPCDLSAQLCQHHADWEAGRLMVEKFMIWKAGISESLGAETKTLASGAQN